MEAYGRMSPEESDDYDKVKNAILQRYQLTGEAYRKKFRNCKQQIDETFKEWSVRAANYADRWLESEDVNHRFDQLSELVIMELLLDKAGHDLQVWLRERHPQTLESMVEMADQYLAVHKIEKKEKNGLNRGKSDNKNDQGKPSEKSSNDAGRRCFRCNKTGHIAIDCPNKGKDKSSGEKSITAGYVCKGKHTNDISRQLSVDEDTTPGLSQFREPGKINGQKVQLLRDTGCTHTMVRASLVPAQAYLDDMDIVIRLVDGSTRRVPTAMVHIESKHVSGDVRVGVLDTLPEDVLLGNDLAASDMAVSKPGSRRK